MGSFFTAIGNGLDALFKRFDRFQRSRRRLAFVVAVVKKYADDEAGHKAALLTYYGFLSIFPLLLVLTSLVTLLAQHGLYIGHRIVAGAVAYFPVVGHELQSSIHGLDKSGTALFIGILITLYGARGIADSLRNSVDHVWQVPYVRRTPFPASLLKDLEIIVVGGFGLALAPVLSSVALALGHSWGFRLIALAAASIVLFWTLVFTVQVASSVPRTFSDIFVGILLATISLEILQQIGVVLMTKELQRLNNLYGTFAVVLGLIFWIYLQTQVLVYALEIDVVRVKKLWPRSLTGELTPADRKAYKLYSERTTYHDASVARQTKDLHDK